MEGMGGIFGFIGLISGLYVFYAWYQMKALGEINQTILLPPSVNVNNCKDKKAYTKEALPKMLVLGTAAVVYGITDLYHTFVGSVGNIFWAVVVGVLFTLIWFAVAVSKMNKKYF